MSLEQRRYYAICKLSFAFAFFVVNSYLNVNLGKGMAIGFARVEFVKRSSGKNACAKAAYNSRSEIEFKGNTVADPKIYNWSHKPKPAHHEILLPKHVDTKFQNAEFLWNAVEQKEIKSNAQVAIEVVLALPDDKMVSIEDKIELTRGFVQRHFVDKGLAAQVDIHAPEPLLIITRDNQELGLKKGMKGDLISRTADQITFESKPGDTISFNPKEFTGFVEKKHNWHAHVLITTRRFKENGLEFEDHKARDLMPRINKGKVISGPDWGKLWAQHQNEYFQEKGLDLRVDINGVVPQEHLGPFRMRGSRSFDLFMEHNRLLDSNSVEVKDPEKILEVLTANKSIFTKEDVGYFLSKHVLADDLDEVSKNFWQQLELVQMVNKRTGELLQQYTSKKVIEEEKQILRLADRIYGRESFKIDSNFANSFSNELNQEQKKAFHGIISGQKLSLIQGYAGTGKSYLLKALHTTYEEAGYHVRSFGPDNATAKVLTDKGLPNAENVFQFLYTLYYTDKRNISKGNEVWLLDEAGKLGNRELLEFLREAEKKDVKVVLSGDIAQLPPVGRGGMFKVFYKQYDPQVLEDIQRQKTDQHLEITRGLAKGEFGFAIDKLSTAHGLHWSANKKESMEALITRWSQDTRSFPQSTALIIAHTNKEVRTLNEMVRSIRRERGELGKKEFKCPTPNGDIYVSVGDRILFRGKNKELGITNGLFGTLIEAREDQFVVSIKADGNQKQTVVFDPQKYHTYQLGYAGTLHRSQGETIDRAYVLHSPMMNREAFYVGLTRHVRDVSYFVSKEDAYCLADLKRQVIKSCSKALTVNYTTLEDVNAHNESQDRLRRIQDLKQSDSVIGKAKGYGLQTWENIVNKAVDMKDHIQDRFPNRDFYNPSLPDSKDTHLPVTEVNAEEPINLDFLVKEKTPISTTDKPISTSTLEDPRSLPSLSHLVDKVQPDQEAIANEYLNAMDKAVALKLIVDAETESTSRDMRFAAHFQAWQEACGLRNQSAHELLQKIPAKELDKLLNPKALTIIQDQSSRYESSLARKEGVKQQLDEQLRTNLEPLLYRLFPEGPTSRNRTSFRFGNKGSLSVVHSGDKAGQFFDFEQNAGGGLLTLIQREMGLGKAEAKAWAQDFLGIALEMSMPRTFARPTQKHKSADTWISIKPDPQCPAPKLEELKAVKLGFYYDEAARHAYKDENGQLLYYVLRLQEKNDPKRKITPPLSYGYWQSNPDKIGWMIKGFHADKSPLYNLHLLKETPHATVLVVEGEKTADQALSKLSGGSYVCVTWSGGAGAAQRADWTPLQGRKVLIWPDNDKAGHEAGNRVCHELRKVGVESVQLVNKEDLNRHFPEKWDLADPLPTGTSKNLISKLVASAEHKGINPEQIMRRLALDPTDVLQKARINEILWRVDERLRSSLEEKQGAQSWKTQETILNEATRLVSDADKRKKDLKKEFGVAGTVLERLNYQVSIRVAQEGKTPKMSEINLLKDVIQQHGHISMPKAADERMSDFAVDKLLTVACDRALSGFDLKGASFKSQKEVDSTMHQVQTQMDQQTRAKGVHKRGVSKDTDISIG